MSNSKAIKNRIKSVKSTKKITKAMELVSASKMKRAVASTLASRLYAGYSWEILTSIAKNTENITNPLFNEREVNKILLVLITSNRGLCGAYNAQIIKKALNLLKQKDSKIQIDILSVGKRGDMAMRRVGKNVIASFFEIPDNTTLTDVVPIAKFLVDEYKTGGYDKVLIVYTDFISGLTQKPNIRQILPISKSSIKEALEDLLDKPEQKTDYLFEGDFNMLIETLAEKITRMQIYQMLLESNASEQSSRMVAMKNASEASGEMIDDLTLVFNKARQANITREISEISAGMASVG
ncbi:TPA: ATP synthase F1 subunit gamma [Candidatus Nomurabacteria bacterium]|uniref:ATP synthase gamma chain n=2 Tax=Candidatus Nomuraibacteriota TaxID=1752729 RepID=A0A1F6YM87_9BACT|nr:MAG: ATP synthase gamma chain [Parcubacteria group bacterium GW2011_GWC1_42_21]KKS58331.1 MAG: ATP synthase gamma chain [Candidatus Nomurabacteria bacterium GW2011_GWF1_42_40]KKT00674.1 MAG: ATP synthase gamma chain [Candidatus Nomurabacteria bacterium GW2011_GWA1_43_17]KKT07653.1 MAG: ATP synthase gamma chain [Candidatus Nomurabacteria bacterium GW2011_GWB1_43_19]KKT11833.1 MAG: ATP synthase gamma chain [Candidatus Nomurabacteria bacterium GW2011_GWF2_43_24]KKT18414.1 MAG: ATP synthase gam